MKPGKISVRGTTRDAFRDYCAKQGVEQTRTLDVIINEYLDAAGAPKGKTK